MGAAPPLRIVLLDKRGQHLRRVALQHMEQAVLLVLQGAARIMQHAHAGARLPLHKGNRIQLRERTRHHMLAGTQPLHRAQAVAQQRRALELQLLGGLVHLLGQFFFQLFASPSNREIA